MRYTVIFGTAAIVAFSSSPIAAQDVPDGFRSALGGNFGLIHYGAGKAAERQLCPTHPGFALGVEGRTRRKWYVAAGAEGLLTISYLLDAFIPLTVHEDQVVEIWSFVEFTPGLRVRARAGRILEVGAFRIETGLGGGVVAGKTQFSQAAPDTNGCGSLGMAGLWLSAGPHCPWVSGSNSHVMPSACSTCATCRKTGSSTSSTNGSSSSRSPLSCRRSLHLDEGRGSTKIEAVRGSQWASQGTMTAA